MVRSRKAASSFLVCARFGDCSGVLGLKRLDFRAGIGEEFLGGLGQEIGAA
jgi:hypothetical protein